MNLVAHIILLYLMFNIAIHLALDGLDYIENRIKKNSDTQERPPPEEGEGSMPGMQREDVHSRSPQALSQDRMYRMRR